jgi:hypothetical protein
MRSFSMLSAAAVAAAVFGLSGQVFASPYNYGSSGYGHSSQPAYYNPPTLGAGFVTPIGGTGAYLGGCQNGQCGSTRGYYAPRAYSPRASGWGSTYHAPQANYPASYHLPAYRTPYEVPRSYPSHSVPTITPYPSAGRLRNYNHSAPVGQYSSPSGVPSPFYD